MAKKKKSVKKQVKRRVKKTDLRISKSLIVFLIFLFVLILIFGFFKLLISPKNIAIKINSNIPLKQEKSQNPITPYPTSKITPTAVPLIGYCLRVPILTYHHIQPENIAKKLGQTSLTVDDLIFDSQMSELITRGYTPIFANELINALITRSALPGKPIMVTMDDGYADNYTYALPILRKYNIRANLMLASGLVGSNSDMLTWDKIKEMKSSGLFYFTNHTWSHASLIRIPQSKIEAEIDTAKNQIEQYTGQSVNIFTYPYGEFNNNAVLTLKTKGYLGGFTTIPSAFQCDSFIMTLHRYHIGNAPLSAYGL